MELTYQWGRSPQKVNNYLIYFWIVVSVMKQGKEYVWEMETLLDRQAWEGLEEVTLEQRQTRNKGKI